MRRAPLMVGLVVALATTASAVTLFFARTADSGVHIAARVICHESMTEVVTHSVRPQGDGVHFVVENRTRLEVSLAGAPGWAVGIPPPMWSYTTGNKVSPGFTKELVWAKAAGPIKITCRAGHGSLDDGSRLAYLRIVDPEGIYVPASLDCEGDNVRLLGGYRLLGPEDDPLRVAKQNLAGLRTHDSFEVAEYPEQQFPVVVRVVRRGRSIALVKLYVGHATDVYPCPDSGISVRK